MPLPTTLSLSSQNTDSRGTYLMVMASECGRCGSCGKVTCCFITRGGKTECVWCDTMRGIQSSKSGRANDPRLLVTEDEQRWLIEHVRTKQVDR